MQGDKGAGQSSEPGGSDTHNPHLMGVRVVVDPDPAGAATRLADELGGELIVDRETAHAAFAARAAAGRITPVVLREGEVDDLLTQAGEVGSLDERPAVDEGALTELRELAAAIARTDRIRMRTEVEFAETLHRRLSASSGVAVHPEALRQAASAVTAAEDEIKAIDGALTELGDRPRPEAVGLDTPDPVPQMFDDEGLEQQRRSRVFALSIGTIFAGVALVLLSVDIPVVAPVIVFLLGIIIAGVMLVRSFSIEPRNDPGAREASALLASATGNAERSGSAAARDGHAEEQWLTRRSQLDAARERASEKVRSVRRHWETLAGADADPYDLDGVLRLHDPQFVITGAATKTSPTVRTVNAVHRKAMARWKVAWAALGFEQPPPLEEFDEHITRLGGGGASVEAEQVEQRLKAARAWADAGAMIDRPMILVEPARWLPESELESMLHTLPAGAEVILVRRENG